MNDEWQPFHDLARSGASHPLHIARHGAEARHRFGIHEGSPTGDIVCCICWGHAADADACHRPHRVPGVPDAFEGCCPAHHIRSRFWIETEADDGRADQPASAPRQRPRVVADGGRGGCVTPADSPTER